MFSGWPSEFSFKKILEAVAISQLILYLAFSVVLPILF